MFLLQLKWTCIHHNVVGRIATFTGRLFCVVMRPIQGLYYSLQHFKQIRNLNSGIKNFNTYKLQYLDFFCIHIFWICLTFSPHVLEDEFQFLSILIINAVVSISQWSVHLLPKKYIIGSNLSYQRLQLPMVTFLTMCSQTMGPPLTDSWPHQLGKLKVV